MSLFNDFCVGGEEVESEKSRHRFRVLCGAEPRRIEEMRVGWQV